VFCSEDAKGRSRNLPAWPTPRNDSTPPYHPLIAERQKAAKTRLYFVEGLPQ